MLRPLRPALAGLLPGSLPRSFLFLQLLLLFQLILGLELVFVLTLLLRIELIAVAIPVLSQCH